MTNGPEILFLGEAMVEFVRQPDERTFRQGFGGDTSNAAIAAARQGARTGYVTAVGADRFGDDLIALWQREGVDTSTVLRDAEAPTGIYFVDPDPSGRHFTYYRAGSAASRMAPGALDRARIRAARLLHLSGITLAVSPDLRAAGMVAAEHVRAAGGGVSLDTNLRLKLWGVEEARAHLTSAMRLARVVFTSIDDQEHLSGEADPSAIARSIRRLGPEIVAITMGAGGCLLSLPDGDHHLAPAPSDPVDSTGAGDSFAGAFLAWWAETGDPLRAGHLAAVTAAATVSALGAIEAIPDRATVLARAAAPGRP
jgi:2-dehydro-3-deoxygluconokinase